MPSLHSPKLEVLIVDDEVQARELLSEFSRAQGYEVAMATSYDSRAASRSDPFSAAIQGCDDQTHLDDHRSVQRARANRDARFLRALDMTLDTMMQTLAR